MTYKYIECASFARLGWLYYQNSITTFEYINIEHTVSKHRAMNPYECAHTRARVCDNNHGTRSMTERTGWISIE